jgi:putative Mg2+ transporter-C (MgtC) family protein
MNVFLDQDINASVSALRLFMSLVAGGLIGFERERRRQPAGLRTHILICVGSTLLMLLSIYIPQKFFDMKNGDPGRIAAQVVSGIGFLGAGAILKLGINVKGLTTAASIWVVAAVGLAIGAGLYIPSLIALAIILFALVVLDYIENFLFPPERIKTIRLSFEGSSVDTKRIKKAFSAYKISIQSIGVAQEIQKGKVHVNLLASIPQKLNIPEFYKAMGELPDIYKIEMDEEY